LTTSILTVVANFKIKKEAYKSVIIKTLKAGLEPPVKTSPLTNVFHTIGNVHHNIGIMKYVLSHTCRESLLNSTVRPHSGKEERVFF